MPQIGSCLLEMLRCSINSSSIRVALRSLGCEEAAGLRPLKCYIIAILREHKVASREFTVF